MKSLGESLTRVSALRPAIRRSRPLCSELPAGSDGLAQILGAERRSNRFGEHLLLRRWYSSPEPCAAPYDALELLAPSLPAGAAEPEKWLFLDTETTGLAGGTGTCAFLVGLAWWDSGGLQVEQFFMRDFTEEHSLLEEVSRRIAARPVLVTFNGKSFDWPLLETRYRMTRSIAPPELAAHLDLLHPARHLWRLRLGSVRLTELERHVLAAESSALGWSRECDVRSELTPQIYFDFLRGGSSAAMTDVFRHNQMDLRGLAALAGRIVFLLSQPETTEDAFELYGLSKLVRRRGRPAVSRARGLYERALSAGLPADVDRAARRELAALAKRDRDFPRATELWEELIGEEPEGEASLAPTSGRDTFAAYEQLAIYYEHQARQPERAAELVREALAALRRALRRGLLDVARFTRLRARFERRLARLNSKQPQTGPVSF